MWEATRLLLALPCPLALPQTSAMLNGECTDSKLADSSLHMRIVSCSLKGAPAPGSAAKFGLARLDLSVNTPWQEMQAASASR